MKIISIVGQKGGTGKTTLAQILLTAFERDGLTVAGIDLDPQASLCTWADKRGKIAVVPVPSSRLTQTLRSAANEAVNVVVIDTAGRTEEASLAAAKAADLVIVPMQPTATDLVTASSSLAIIKLANVAKSFVVLMRVKMWGTRHIEAVAALSGLGFSVCPYHLGDRVAYQDAAAAGLCPVEFDAKGKAAKECQKIYRFTCLQIDMTKQ